MMKVSELCAVLNTDKILLFDKSINKVITLEHLEAISQIYGDRVVDGIIATGLMQMSITIL